MVPSYVALEYEDHIKCHFPFSWWKSLSSSASSLGSLRKWLLQLVSVEVVSLTCVSPNCGWWNLLATAGCWVWFVWFSKICYMLAGIIIFLEWFFLKIVLNCCFTVSRRLRLIMPKVALKLLLLHDILCYSSPARKQIFIWQGESWKCFYKCMDLLNCYTSSTCLL